MGGEPMTVEPQAPNPENRSQTSAGPQSGTQPPPQDNASPPSGNVPQSQAGTATSSGTQLSFDFRRLRPGDLIAGIASFVVLITLFLPWYSFAASAASASENATPAQQQLVPGPGSLRAITQRGVYRIDPSAPDLE